MTTGCTAQKTRGHDVYVENRVLSVPTSAYNRLLRQWLACSTYTIKPFKKETLESEKNTQPFDTSSSKAGYDQQCMI